MNEEEWRDEELIDEELIENEEGSFYLSLNDLRRIDGFVDLEKELLARKL